MKKLFYFALVCLALQACREDEYELPSPPPETFTRIASVTEAVIENISDEYEVPEAITELSLVARYHGHINHNPQRIIAGDEYRIMKTVPFNRNSTTIVFPEEDEIPEKLFYNITNDFPNGFTISDRSARTVSNIELAYMNDDKSRVIGFFHQKKEYFSNYYEAQYMYCDRPVSITGTAPDWWNNTTTCNLNLEKGWNLVIRKKDNSNFQKRMVTISNEMPGDMVWIYDGWIGR